jgi:hypothetical protein
VSLLSHGLTVLAGCVLLAGVVAAILMAVAQLAEQGEQGN